MSWLPLSFAFPAALWGLLALPAIWWLLRLTPPRPQTEVFPPLRILARVVRREETPQHSPWWLTLLRLALAAAVILAIARPVYEPRETPAAVGPALALAIDNGWASAPDWPSRVATAEQLIAEAEHASVPVLLAFTAEKPNAEVGPFDAGAARDRLRAAIPRPVAPDRPANYRRLAEALQPFPGATIGVLSDGLAAPEDRAAFAALLEDAPGRLIWAAPERLETIGLTGTRNDAGGFAVTAVRPQAGNGPRRLTVGAYDDKGRRIADAALAFAAGADTATARMNVPFELRNDFTFVAIDGEKQAGAVRVLDESSKRRRVGLLTQSEADEAQPLLSPLYYIRRALEPFADLVEPKDADLGQAVAALIDRKAAMIVMADIATLPEAAHARLDEWVEAGGTLVRFAGPRLAAAEGEDTLLPVKLRTGERTLGGALSWAEPQAVAEFPRTSPFADLPAPREVTVTRQVLAEPSADIEERTWASLADGTPLVTGARHGKGTLVLFHVAAEAGWSNLPISGAFVEMLRRIVQLSKAEGLPPQTRDEQAAALAPYRMIAADGMLVGPSPEAKPLPANAGEEAPTLDNPPGLYGSEAGSLAHNLLAADARLEPIVQPDTAVPLTLISYRADQPRDLRGPALGIALLLLALDALAVMWMGGAFSRLRRGRLARAGTAAALLAALIVPLLLSGNAALADDQRPDDAAIVDSITRTRLAYVVTGNSSIDRISRAGLEGLTRFLIDKTALEPGEPAGVDVATDELAFYPILYWPIDANGEAPPAEAIARIDAYMKQGGTVLFDTRDQYDSGFGGGAVGPATQRLRDILAGLNVPPLEPVPADHVLTKTFYLTSDFPGRYSGSPLWVEASLDADSRRDRPVRSGDGVSPIMITANDLAGAWAVDEAGNPLLPTVPADPLQRIYALRGGVNIVMYMLTGNYKSDQVHVPVLLERLGQ